MMALLDTGFCVKSQRLCFLPKNEPPGYVVLEHLLRGGKIDAYN